MRILGQALAVLALAATGASAADAAMNSPSLMIGRHDTTKHEICPLGMMPEPQCVSGYKGKTAAALVANGTCPCVAAPNSDKPQTTTTSKPY